MTDMLDSRALRYTDCYGQRFMKPGTYRYHVLPMGGECFTRHRPFVVEVKPGPVDAAMRQHNVALRFDQGRFTVDPETVTIAQGDLVLWHCANPRALPYSVVGEKPFFSSDRLTNECGYSHAFAAAGDYWWRDAHGSGAGGVIRVRDPKCDSSRSMHEWHEALAAGSVVTITEGVAEPKDVQIVTGQTVFFAVTKGPGLSITDERLSNGANATRKAAS